MSVRINLVPGLCSHDAVAVAGESRGSAWEMMT